MDLRELPQRIWAVLNDSVVQPLSKLVLDYWEQGDRTGLYVFLALAAGVVIGRFRASRAVRAFSFQNRGEARLSDVVLRDFGPPDYHLMNHVTLQLEDGTTQIDHILVSRFGVFVIETKDYSGWIFGNGKQTSWTQVLFRSKFNFQNPIVQNMRHVRAVQGLLDFLPPEAVKSVVVFAGNAEFKTAMPRGVFRVSDFIDYLREQTADVMSVNRLQFCVGRIETARLAISTETDVEHAESLRRRHGPAA